MPERPTIPETSSPGSAAVPANELSTFAPGDGAADRLPPLPAGGVTLPGYEILERLGRGGQSIVYKARQRALGRLVALKMILANAAANAEERARFRREAEAVAHLEHPHIVQIYDVGEQAGQPYFALEYVAGGTLAKKLAGGPLPGLEAARLLETLARTMHWAHQRGIVHRDLKPGNVLVSADGTLKITDFGLAKRLEADASLTHTGTVMGTPSYMAPEQAAGKTREVGPAADVYALGVVGYEMLTGRPPFLGVTAWDIIPQVLEADPVPLRRLQPAIPRDLETICLKCLHKEPPKRYASADALAEDLRRFQAGQPIRARPVAWPERLLKWVKRRPAVAALTAAVVVIILVGLVTSLVLTGWALRERDRARERLAEAQEADRRRVQAQVEQLGSAAPEAVPGLLAALKEEGRTVLPRLRQLWANESGGRQRRMRAALALLDDDPTMREPLAGWMIEVEDPREMLLVREVLRPHGAELAPGLWNQVTDPKVKSAARFRALVALAAFDPANRRWSKVAPAAVEQLLKANPLFVAQWMQALRPVRDPLQGPLTEVFRGKHQGLADRRLTAATVLADYSADRPAVLAGLACAADAEQFTVLRPVLEKNRKAARTALNTELAKKPPAQESEAGRISRARRQANAAAALVALGEPDAAWSILKHSRTPDARTALIHGLAPRGADPRLLIHWLEEEKEGSIRAALILALGEYPVEQLLPKARATLTPKLLAWYCADPDSGVHGAIDWLLRQWQQQDRLTEIDERLKKDPKQKIERIRQEFAKDKGKAKPQWYVNGAGQTMVVIPGPGKFQMGSPPTETSREGGAEGQSEKQHEKRIGRSFALAAKEVTVEQFQRFRQDQEYNKQSAPTSRCPMNWMTWYEAAAYCNWLSAKEGLECCYQPNEEGEYGAGMKMKPNYLHLTGYRLPTEAEWEYACRAGTATSRYYGEAEELLGKYAWYTKDSRDRWMRPVGSLKPNDWGLFDMLGNALEWCQDRAALYAAGEDTEDKQAIKETDVRVLRGGSFIHRAANVRSALRRKDVPTSRSHELGFRPARTFPLDLCTSLPPQ